MNWKLAALLCLTSSLAFGSDNLEDRGLASDQKPLLVKARSVEGAKRKREEQDNFYDDSINPAKHQRKEKVKKTNLLALPNDLFRKIAGYLGQRKITLVEDNKFQLNLDSLDYEAFALSCKRIYQALKLSKENKGEFILDCNQANVASQDSFRDILSRYGTRISTIELQPTNLKHFLPFLKNGKDFLPRLKNLSLEIYDEDSDEPKNSLSTNEINELGECLKSLKIENLRIGVGKLEDITPAFEKMDQALANLQKLHLFIYFSTAPGDLLKSRLQTIFSKMKNLTHFSSNNFDIESVNVSISALTLLRNLDIIFGEDPTLEALQKFNNNISMILTLRELALSGFGRNEVVLPDNFLKLPSLIRLSITGGAFESASRKNFLGQLSNLVKLEFLNLEGNGLDDVDVKEFSESLPYLADLKELNLYGNQISDKGISYLIKKFPLLPKLETLFLKNNLMTSTGRNEIIEATKKATTTRKDGSELRVIVEDEGGISMLIALSSAQSFPMQNHQPFSFVQMLEEGLDDDALEELRNSGR